MMAMKWSSLFFFLLVSSGCMLFSLQADSSVSSLLGLGCRRFILPHISGRSVSLFPLRFELQANLTAPYFRQVCQLSLVHSSRGVVVHFTSCDILITILCEMWVFTSPVLESWSRHQKGTNHVLHSQHIHTHMVFSMKEAASGATLPIPSTLSQ